MAQLTPQEIARGCLLRIVAQPGRYEQETWQTVVASDVSGFDGNGYAEVSCATTGCVAGTAAMLAGDRGIAVKDSLHSKKGRMIYDISRVITSTGMSIGIRDRGRDLLNLTEREANWLFDGSRKLPEVVNALVELSEGRELSRKHQSDMTNEEVTALMNYRVPKQVKRQRVPAEPVTPVQAAVHHGG